MSLTPAEIQESNRKTMATLDNEVKAALFLVEQVEAMQRDLTAAYWKAIEARSAVLRKFDALVESGALNQRDVPAISFPNGGWNCLTQASK